MLLSKDDAPHKSDDIFKLIYRVSEQLYGRTRMHQPSTTVSR